MAVVVGNVGGLVASIHGAVVVVGVLGRARGCAPQGCRCGRRVFGVGGVVVGVRVPLVVWVAVVCRLGKARVCAAQARRCVQRVVGLGGVVVEVRVPLVV